MRQIAHPWIKRKYSMDECEFPEELKQHKSSKKYKRVVLLSLSSCYDGEHPYFYDIIPNGVIPGALVEAIADTKDDIFWLLRLHPSQLTGRRYKRHRDLIDSIVKKHSNTESKISSRVGLGEILSGCTGHITMLSMTSYEAAFAGVPSLLMCPTLGPGRIYEHMFSDLRKEGYAELRVNPRAEHILNWAKKSKKIKKKIYGEGGCNNLELIQWMIDEKLHYKRDGYRN